jgi:hypothetical protein
MQPKIGDLVRIVSIEANFGQGQTGTLEELKDGGYVVTITTTVPVTGVCPGNESKNVTVWASEVEKV